MAFLKAMKGAGQHLPDTGTVFISVNNSDKPTVLPIAKDLAALGFSLAATRGTAAYLRSHGLVESRKEANWVIYRLPAKPSRELTANLACLQDCAQEDPVFRKDAARRAKLAGKFSAESPICCAPKTTKNACCPTL